MKKNVLKVLAIALIALVMSGFSAFAQEAGDKAVGINLGIGTGNVDKVFEENLTNIGIGAKFQYNLTAPVRVEGAFNYYFKKDYLNIIGDISLLKVSMWDLGVNAHYLFPVIDKVNVYPLVGIGVAGYNTSSPLAALLDDDDENPFENGNETTPFANIGAGAEYGLTDQINVNLELKYRINFKEDFANRFLISVGVAYKF
jgi:outer membrane protein X